MAFPEAKGRSPILEPPDSAGNRKAESTVLGSVIFWKAQRTQRASVAFHFRRVFEFLGVTSSSSSCHVYD